MSYELFEKAAAINGEFDLIPSKTSIIAKGIVINNNGYIQYKGKTYLPNMVKLIDLPGEIRSLFKDKQSIPKPIEEGTRNRSGVNPSPSSSRPNFTPPAMKPKNTEIQEVKSKNEHFDKLNKILFEQLENIVDPDDGVDINQELKKANAICNVADKIISIADLSLKAEMFSYKKKYPNGKSIYQD